MGHAHHDHGGSPLHFTGERVIPDEPGFEWCFQAHKFGYDDLLARIPSGARVADIGCGEGYGVAQLATKARLVVASDYSFEAVSHARARYRAPNIVWLVADAQHLPFAPASFDVVSSLQVIEHFRETDSHLAGVARSLRPDGWHYVATPNIDNMSQAEADNEFHLRDFTAPDLEQALAGWFSAVEVVGMFYVESSPRVKRMRAAEDTDEQVRPKLDRVERLLAKLPGRIRVRLRPIARRLAGVPDIDANAARNAILAEDFEARPPASESFCLIGIASQPRSQVNPGAGSA